MQPYTEYDSKNALQHETIELSELPGPAGIPLLGNLLQLSPEKFHRVIEKWSNQYGSIFKIRLGTAPVIVITDPEAIQYVLKHRPEKFRRSAKMDEVMCEMGILGVFNAEGAEWKRQRKLFSQALSMNQVKNFFPALVGLTQKLLSRFNAFSEKNAPIEIRSEMMRYTVDVTSELAFGYAMNNLENNHDNIRHHLKIIFPALFKRINFPIPYWRYFRLPADRKLDNALRAINQIIRLIINDNRTKLAEDVTLKENPTNFLQALIVACEQDDSLSNQVLIGNVLTMLLAGEDTTAHTLAWILYFMHVNPGVQQKMQQEADNVLKGGVLNSFEDAAKLRYIEAVAFEAMRLKPVGPVMFFDTVEEVVIEKIKVPKDTGVFIQTQYASISEKHFSDAGTFLPERWLGNQCPVHNEKASVPFGAGPRYCPGHGLAMIEIKSILSMVCKNFHVTMETNPEEVKEILAFTMMPTGFAIRLTKRQ